MNKLSDGIVLNASTKEEFEFIDQFQPPHPAFRYSRFTAEIRPPKCHAVIRIDTADLTAGELKDVETFLHRQGRQIPTFARS